MLGWRPGKIGWRSEMFGFGSRRRTRYDRYEEEDEKEQTELAKSATVAPVDKLDYRIALCMAGASALFLFLFSYKWLHPDAWHDCAIAAGMRPAMSIAPGLWRVVAGILYKIFGLTLGNLLIMLLGKAGLGLCVGLTYLTFREVLAILVRPTEAPDWWKTLIVRVLAGVPAVLFFFADPVWTLGYAFTPQLMLAMMFSLSVYLFAHFIGAGTVKPAYLAMFVAGLFCAESPFGFVALAILWMSFYILLKRGSLFHVRLLEPLSQQSSKWYLTFFWAVGLILGITLNIIGFACFDGMAATGTSVGSLPLKYVVELWKIASGAASGFGWLIGFSATALPCLIGISMLRRATDLEHFLSYHIGVVFFAIGCLAYSQISSLYPLWFWTLGKSITVSSPVLLYVSSFLCAATILCTLTVSVVDSYLRDHARLAALYNPDLEERPDKPAKGPNAIRNRVFLGVAVALILGQLPGRLQSKTRRMMSIVDDYIDEIVREAGDAKWLFTDGSYDCAIEMEAARKDKDIMCVSLIPTGDARDAWSISQTMDNDEDRMSAKVGGANILRSWQASKPEKIDKCAMQLGLEVWKTRAGRDYPPTSGVLARTSWADAKEVADGVKRTKKIAKRIFKFYAKGGPSRIAGRKVNDLFLFLQWRIARLARIRSEIFDRAGDAKAAQEEAEFADRLDAKNEALQAILDGMKRLRDHTLRQMTPREGLHFALVRADFMLARRFAEPILDATPDDVDANFGMGMSYFLEEQYSRAEEHLMRCLRQKPGEPAFWNNIAVLQMRLFRFAEARQNAQKALALLPDSAEIKDTLKQIDAAEKKAEKEKQAEAEKKAKEAEKKEAEVKAAITE